MSNETAYIPLIVQTFEHYGLDPALACALVKHESNWNPNATATNPKDLARGGSYGLFQLSLETVQAFQSRVQPQDLYHPHANALYAARLTQANLKALHAHGLDTTENLAAAHNCGVTHVLNGTIPASTRDVYVPAVMAQYEKYKAKLTPPKWAHVP